jgi:hypothetical protein
LTTALLFLGGLAVWVALALLLFRRWRVFPEIAGLMTESLRMLKCALGFHEAEHPYVRQGREKGEFLRWWRCKHCGKVYPLPAEH